MTDVLGSLLRDASGLVDRRFFLNALLPSVLFCGLVVIIVIASRQGGVDAAVQAWNAAPAGIKTLQVSGFVAAVGLMASGLVSQRTSVLRWFEGYWTSPVGRVLADVGRRFHRQRHARLGTLVAELYPYARYSIDAVLTWPRLYQLLPERFLATFSVAKADLDLMLGLSALSALFGAGSAVYLLAVGGPWSLYLACLWGCGGARWQPTWPTGPRWPTR